VLFAPILASFAAVCLFSNELGVALVSVYLINVFIFTGFTFSVDTNPRTLSELPFRSEVVTADDLPSSVHTVVSNDDLLIEILLRLPVISLFLCKSVSKRWLSLFKDAQFTLRLSQIPKLYPSCGLFPISQNNTPSI
jgi:hypothetical protein